jgi:hypothetical protein
MYLAVPIMNEDSVSLNSHVRMPHHVTSWDQYHNCVSACKCPRSEAEELICWLRLMECQLISQYKCQYIQLSLAI